MKTKPFNIQEAKAGAKVVTADGHEVTIVNYNLSLGSCPILGRYTANGLDVYEVWPEDGRYLIIDDVGAGRPLPPDLLLVVDESGHYEGSDFEVQRLKNKISELEARNRELEIINDNLRDKRDERLRAAQDAELVRKNHYKELEAELAAYRDGSYTKAKIDELNAMIEAEAKRIAELEHWKAGALMSFKKWNDVQDYLMATARPNEWGKDIQEVVLERLKRAEKI